MRETKRPEPHPWLDNLHLAFHAGHQDPVLNAMGERMLKNFSALGHTIQTTPDEEIGMVLTTAPFGQVIEWREALMFTARKKFNLGHTPVVVTMIRVEPEKFNRHLRRLEEALEKKAPDPEDYPYQGLAKGAHRVIYNQGRRGGAILALERILQAQSKSIRVLLVIGDEKPDGAYLFNLVGAHPYLQYHPPVQFYREIALQLTTALSNREVTNHKVVGAKVARAEWERLSTPDAMKKASRMLGERNFFTNMVRIEDLVDVPVVSSVVASQYSEGCFATWDPVIECLVTTVTGSARPVKKDRIREEDLALISGIREDGQGALVRHVEHLGHDPPSSEAVELIALDRPLPQIEHEGKSVPVVRSKLHGHRGVGSYDPDRVEFVHLDQPYYHYPVSCATEAQAKGIRDAFTRAETLQNPGDPRQLAFTVLPGHGVVIVEKWVDDKEPFQLMWEAMDQGVLRIDQRIPQGPFHYAKKEGHCVLVEGSLVSTDD